MGSQVSRLPENVNSNNNNNVKLSRGKRMDRLEENVMKKLSSAASKLRIGKRKDKVVQTAVEKPAKDSFKESPPPAPTAVTEKTQVSSSSAPAVSQTQPQVKPKQQQPLPPLPNKPTVTVSSNRGLPHHVVAATRVQHQPRKWTLTDLLQTLGSFVQSHCTHLHTVPSASEVAMWVRCADRALQLNGWTINSFLLESHVVFTYMLIAKAFQQFNVRTLTDVKELVLMCLYISYTYNANEISYPLRPFLVKQDRASFWDKCTRLSLGASSEMLRLNQDHTYYHDTLTSLKRSGLHSRQA